MNEKGNEWKWEKKIFFSYLIGVKMRGKENKDKDNIYCLF